MRKADMSMLAAQTLRAVLAKMEAALMLLSNQERVVQDITNPGPENIDGKKLKRPIGSELRGQWASGFSMRYHHCARF